MAKKAAKTKAPKRSSKTTSTAKTKATKKKVAKKTAPKKSSEKASPKKRTAKKKAATLTAAEDVGTTEVPVDRREAAQSDRRKNGNRRQEAKAVDDDRRVLPERRSKVARRRQIDPTTCERDYSDEEIVFMHALDDYKRRAGRMFPTCSEILEVLRDLGYRKLTSEETAILAARDANAGDTSANDSLGATNLEAPPAASLLDTPAEDQYAPVFPASQAPPSPTTALHPALSNSLGLSENEVALGFKL